jgi:hypothetical protein
MYYTSGSHNTKLVNYHIDGTLLANGMKAKELFHKLNYGGYIIFYSAQFQQLCQHLFPRYVETRILISHVKSSYIRISIKV